MRLHEIEKKIDVSSIITPGLKRIETAFRRNHHEIRIVGGAPRDLILGKTPKDVDLATTATPEEMKRIFNDENLRWLPTGEKHGTLTVLDPFTKEQYEVTTLRIDTNHTGRHADVEFTRNWKADAARRDLSYNAFSVDFEGTLYDYFGGLDDLQQGQTRFVGDAHARINEDFLRILRLFRFAARYGHPIDRDTKKAIADNAAHMSKISGERIWMEMSKILAGPNSTSVLQVMDETGITKVIGLPIRDLRHLDDVKHRTDNPVTLLATQLVDGNEVDQLQQRWKFSNPERDLARFIVDHKSKNLNHDRLQDLLAHGAKKEHVHELANVVGITSSSSLDAPVFPVTGKHLIALGAKPGPDIGRTLSALKQKWVDSRFRLSKEELLADLNI